MTSLSDVELLFLFRLITEDLDKMERKIDRCRRYLARGEDKYRELSLAEAEYTAMYSVKKRINAVLALRELTADFYCEKNDLI